jgi:hypothetical protein
LLESNEEIYLLQRVWVILLSLLLGEVIAGNASGAGSGQDNGPDGDQNTSNCTRSEGAEFSNKHTAGTKKRNAKENNTSVSRNRNPAKKVRKNTHTDSDPEAEEISRNSLDRAGERPKNISGRTQRNKVQTFMLDSDSETSEGSHASVMRKDDAPNAERSGVGGDLNATAKKKLRNVIFDSDSESEEISLNSMVQKDYILGTRSVADDSSCGSAKNTVTSFLSHSRSKNEVLEAKDEQARREWKRVLSASDSDGDISHSIKRNKTAFSADEANTVDTKQRHTEEDIRASSYMPKHKRRIIVSDDEDD